MNKSEFPYLVDISISTACPFQCQFCYTSSTKEGLAADVDYLESLAKILAQARVFEVVLGGGEPTLYTYKHPRFGSEYDIVSVLSYFKNENFKVGITTKNYNLHKHPKFKEIISKLHTIAISCNTLEELKKAKVLREKIHTYSHEYPKIYIQSILGLNKWADTKKFLQACKKAYFNDVTLLGFKDFGFGKKSISYTIKEEWIDYVKELGINIGIDSILANSWREALIKNGVKNYALVGAEGKSSCYIDAVNQTIKPSSFTDEKYDFKNINNYRKEDKDRFLDIFSKF